MLNNIILCYDQIRHPIVCVWSQLGGMQYDSICLGTEAKYELKLYYHIIIAIAILNICRKFFIYTSVCMLAISS